MLKKRVIGLTVIFALLIGMFSSVGVSAASIGDEIVEASSSAEILSAAQSDSVVGAAQNVYFTVGAKDGDYKDIYTLNISPPNITNESYYDGICDYVSQGRGGSYDYLFGRKTIEYADSFDKQAKDSIGVFYHDRLDKTSVINKVYAYGVNVGTATYKRCYTSNSSNYYDEYKMTVKKAPTSLKFSRNGSSIPSDGFTIGVGETIDIDYSYTSGSFSNNLKWVYSTAYDVKLIKRNETSGTFRITGKSAGSGYFTLKTYNEKSDKCLITVKNAPTKVSLNKSDITIGVGETFSLTSSVPDGCASNSIVYSSNNTSVCTVSTSGLITGKKAGTATITTKTYNGKTATCKVTVKNAPSKVSLNKSSMSIGVGETVNLVPSLPSGTASYSISYISNDTSVCSVNKSSGLLTGKSEGKAVITVYTFNGKTASCTVTVKKAPRDGDAWITCKDTDNCIVEDIKMLVGDTFDFDYHLPTGYATYHFSYSSDNTDVCSVTSSGGYVTANSVGTCNIIGTTFNGKTAVCRVTVVDTMFDIKDATLIQMIVAKFQEATDYQKFLYDVDKDGDLTIRDATLIQLQLAGLA